MVERRWGEESDPQDEDPTATPFRGDDPPVRRRGPGGPEELRRRAQLGEIPSMAPAKPAKSGGNATAIGCVVFVVVAAFVGWGVVKLGSDSSSAPSSPPAAAAPAPAATTQTAAAPAATALVVDLPQFDQAGSGPGCDMHYSQTADGMTITRFTLAGSGELITHVSGSDYVIHRNDNKVQAGYVAYSYDVPLAQVQDMGAVMTFSDGSSASCSIGPGADAP